MSADRQIQFPFLSFYSALGKPVIESNHLLLPMKSISRAYKEMKLNDWMDGAAKAFRHFKMVVVSFNFKFHKICDEVREVQQC